VGFLGHAEAVAVDAVEADVGHRAGACRALYQLDQLRTSEI
jgi:hypothetical protein